MRAFYSFWSLPNRVRNNGAIGFPDFELLTSILSALSWQKTNGPVSMITDSAGASFFTRIGLGDLWDTLDTSLDQVDPDIDPILFWAAGKLYALKTMELPCVMLDTDLIIWKNLDELWNWKNLDIIAAHGEGINPVVYPDPRGFSLKEGYSYPADWDFSLDAANTAFLYMKDTAFRDYYVDAAIDFFKNIHMDGLNPVTAMCFAEQRVLPLCAKQKGKSLGYLLDLRAVDQQDIATHTWGYKSVLRSDPAANHEFCLNCVRKILREFPERASLLTGCEELNQYYREVCG